MCGSVCDAGDDDGGGGERTVTAETVVHETPTNTMRIIYLA